MLQPQPATLLGLLLSPPGELVRRESIRKALWGDDTTVDFELGMNRCVRQLRAALLDNGETPQYIETLPKRGYRFIASVSVEAPVSAPAAPVSTLAAPPAPSESARRFSHLTASQPEPSIAVLPFANLSGEQGDEYFSDGLTEEITNTLAQMANLKVIARTSAFAFKGKNEDVRKIAGALGVNHVLEGSVRRAGALLRITAQLIHAQDGAHLLSKRYDREMTDVFAVQEEISTDIAEMLKLQFTVRHQPATDLAAYESFLEGRFHWHKYTPAGFDRAFDCYRRAAAIDPNYGRAYTGMAEYYVAMVTEAGASALDFLPKAAIAAHRALDLNPEDAEAHATLGQVAAMLDYDWTAAESYFRRARQLSPTTHVRMAYIMWFLIPQGRTEEALAECDEVSFQDPLLLVGRTVRASVLIFGRAYDAAVECCLRVLEIDPDFVKALQFLSNARLLQGHVEESVQIAERMVGILGRSYLGLSILGMAQAAAGDRDGAHRTLEDIHRLPHASQGAPSLIAGFYAMLGDRKNALTWMKRAIERRDPRMLWRPTHPWSDALTADPQFRELVASMNLPVADVLSIAP